MLVKFDLWGPKYILKSQSKIATKLFTLESTIENSKKKTLYNFFISRECDKVWIC